MVSHPENGSDSPIGSDRDRGRDTHGFNADLMKNWNRLRGFLSVLVSL